MKTSTACAATIGAIACGAFAYYHFVGNPFDPGPLRTCEEGLTRRLKSPTSYRRVDYWIRKNEISTAEYLNFENRLFPSTPAKWGKADQVVTERYGGPWKQTVTVQYDAQNGFGALIRGVAICEFAFVGDDNDSPSIYGMLLNGDSYLASIGLSRK